MPSRVSAASYDLSATQVRQARCPRRRPQLGRLLLIALALLFLGVFLVLPLLAVFVQAFSKGVSAYLTAISDPMAWAAVKLTLWVAATAVPLNLVFGVTAAWAIAKRTRLNSSHRGISY